MLSIFRPHASGNWLVPAWVAVLYPAAIILAHVTGQHEWLTLAVLPPVIGFFSFRLAAGNLLMVFSFMFFLVAGLVETEPALRSYLWFHLLLVALVWILVYLFHRRSVECELGYEKKLSETEERLALIREQYKTDLVVNTANQKKFQKYSLLNRVSRAFGTQLALDKLAEKVVEEVRDIIGAERGRYFMALDFPERGPSLVRGVPEDGDLQSVMQDQYAAWAIGRCGVLSVADTLDDFRFHPPAAGTLVRSLMITPMQAEGKVFGVLRAESPWPDIFNNDDVRLFTIVADLAGVAAENARLYQYAQELAVTDGLTGLYLRRFFNQRFEEELGRYREHQTPFALLILDLDHFKRVNDELGHLAGDQVLAQLGEILRSEARVADLLCRFGGEEFAILLPNTNLEGALVMAERTRARVAAHVFSAGNEKKNLTVSIGVGECPRHGIDMNDLIRVTDAALYSAKRSGRNRVVLAGGQE